MRHTWLPLILRLLVVLGLILLGFHIAARYALLFAYPAWILAAVLLAFPLACWLASPFGAFLLPSERYRKPLPMYSIPESLRMKNRVQEAFDAYQRIAVTHPREVKPYVEMIRLARVDLKKPELASAVFTADSRN